MLLLIWADEKYNAQKNPCVFFATQKNPGVFHRPQKIPFGQNVRPKKILRTPPSLKYVSGAPGAVVHKYHQCYLLLKSVLIRFLWWKFLGGRFQQKMQLWPGCVFKLYAMHFLMWPPLWYNSSKLRAKSIPLFLNPYTHSFKNHPDYYNVFSSSSNLRWFPSKRT